VPLARPAFAGADAAAKPAETYVKHLFESLTPAQRKVMCFPFSHPKRSQVANNWFIVEPEVGAIGKLYTPDQKEMLRLIFKGVTSEDGHERFQKQMVDDTGGPGFDAYTCAIFGEPGGEGGFEWVMTGRHLTIRADGNSVHNSAFGGPIFYGHAVEATERPDHPGNVWWHQARLANEVYKSLDGKQRQKALIEKDPPDDETTVRLRGKGGEIAGLSARDLSRDQQEHLEKTLKSMLSMYRPADVEEALGYLKDAGGVESLRVAFYQAGDLGDDGIWDRWRVEGPNLVWYFRGSPHVHAWVHVAKSARASV
jgi:hypothetical protein